MRRTEVLWVYSPIAGDTLGQRLAARSSSEWRVTSVALGPGVRAAITALKPALVVLETELLDVARATALREIINARGVAAAVIVSSARPAQPEMIAGTLAVVSPEDVTEAWLDGVAKTTRTLARLMDRAEFMRSADPVTGILSRSAFLEAARACTAADASIALVDLDRFQLMNDVLGFDVGDLVLLEAADRARIALPPETVLGRWSSDEIAIVLVGDARAQLERLRAALRPSFAAAGGEIALTATIGFSPLAGRPADAALVRAAGAVRRGRAMGGDLLVEAEPADEPAQSRWFEIDKSLKQALANRELILHYQPQFDIDGRRVVGFEALLRWQRPSGGLVPPGDFIPALEATGSIVEVGAWVMEEACQTMARWRRQGSTARVAVNASVSQLRRPDFLSVVDRALARSGLPAAQLEVELTESILLDLSADVSIRLIASLKERGVRVAIDDFGTGYSSLAYLRHLPVDVLKIDRAFVKDMHEPKTRGVITAIVGIAHSMGVDTIAEGVETREQLALLADLGCQEVQGFLLARPMPAEAIERWVRDRSSPPDARAPL